MARLYYVDGYNILHASSALRPVARRDFERAREMLIDKVALLCINTGKRVIVVFDGRGHRAEQVAHGRPVPGLEVVYASGNQTADAYIERQVYLFPDKFDVVVVSNDRGMRDLCRGMGALVMEADNFLAETRESREFVDAAVLHSRAPVPTRLEDHLDGDAIAQLRRLRDRLK
jgi:predicted RNA-binding protein with PIN domain